ncbi:MAG: MerR family transcriptional regulator [Pseudomonadota bacterium]
MTNTTEPTHSISELAREFDVTTRTIRFYEEKGYLNPSRDGRKRVYSRRDRTHLRLLLRGRRLGWSLEDTWELISLYDSEEGEAAQLRAMLGRLSDTRVLLQQQRLDIDRAESELTDIESRCLTRLKTAESR